MNYLYIFVTVITFFFLLKRKQLSLLVIYFFSSCVYYWDGFSGNIYIGNLNTTDILTKPICNEMYIVLLINMMLLFFSLILEKDAIIYKEKITLNNEKKIMSIYMIGTFVLSLYMTISYGLLGVQETFNKTELMERESSWVTYYMYMSAFSVVYVFSSENLHWNNIWKIIASIPIFTTFLFGHRSFLVISILAILYGKLIKMNVKKYSNLRFFIKYRKVIFLVMLLFIITMVVKGISEALFTGDYNLLISRVTDIDYFKRVYYFSEPNEISESINEICNQKYQLDGSSYIGLWGHFVPFFTDQIESLVSQKSFIREFHTYVFGIQGGTNRAATFLGESYANGGILMTFIIVGLWLCFLSIIYRYINKCKNSVMKTSLLLIGIDCAFYIHRNSMSFQFTRIRDYIYIVLLIYFAIWFSSSSLYSNSKNRNPKYIND